MKLPGLPGGGGLLTIVGIGAGLFFAGPAITGVVGGVLRPVAKATMKGAWMAFDMIRETGAGMWESIEDLTAEVKTEVEK